MSKDPITEDQWLGVLGDIVRLQDRVTALEKPQEKRAKRLEHILLIHEYVELLKEGGLK